MKKGRITLGRPHVLLSSAIVGLLATVSAAISFAAIPADAHSIASHTEATHHSQTTASVAVQLFASKVETLGSGHYANSFAGAVLTPSGVTKVFAVRSSDGALIHAISTLNKSRYPVAILPARRSYTQLNALSAKLIAANNAIKARGVTLSQAVPDPATGSITVNVVPPTASAMATLSASREVRERISGTVTASNYREAVYAVLTSELGQGFTVESQYLPTATATDGNKTGVPRTPAKRMIRPDGVFDDNAPFFGGDAIISTFSQIPCTGSFLVTGNKSGNAFYLTAGHCSQTSSDGFDTLLGGTAIGPVSTNYWVPGTTNDFLTILVPGGGLPFIWGVDDNVHPVAASLLPAVGVQITFNGSVTGEVPHNTVTAINATDLNVRDSNSGRVYNIFPVVSATPPSATVSCQVGDSGGPAYQRTASSPVDAVGTIVAFLGAPGITLVCSAQQIGYEEKTTSTTLMTTG